MTTTENSVKAWLVDLDGTLYPKRPVQLAMAAELLSTGPRALSVLRTFRSKHEVLRATLDKPVESPFRLQIQKTADACGRDFEETRKIVEHWMVRRPGKWLRLFRRRSLLREIAAFRANGGRVALVSDYPAREKLRTMGIAQLFDVVIANGEENGPGRLKPWPDGYLKAARRLGVEPEACLVIGDRDDADGEAARRAGMLYAKIRPSEIIRDRTATTDS